jgi:UDP-glucose 4-epimerase
MIRLLIDNHECGIYYPQNREYIRSFDLAREIAKVHGKHMYKLKLFHFIICFLQPKISLLRKLFGNQAYSKELSNYYNYAYCVYDFAESIRETENC